jgi:LysR family transcriptional regulator, glycine cleavage system transcriptional activator
MAVHLPPMSTLRAFEAAARTGSLTRAAEALHVTHGAISHQIKALEADLGVRLVERAGRGVRLTDEGERLASRVRIALTDLADAVREVSERANPRALRVSVMPSFAARWLLPRIGTFMAEHPQVDLDVRASALLADFRRDDIDVAIRYGSGNYPGLTVEHLMDDVYFPVCSPNIGGGPPARPADLARYVLLRSDNESWQPWFIAAGLNWPEPTRGPIFNDDSHMMQAAIEGQGIALARTSLIGNDLANGVLVRLFDATVPAPTRYFLVYAPRSSESPKLKQFRAWLKKEIARDDGGMAVLRVKRPTGSGRPPKQAGSVSARGASGRGRRRKAP